jgi:PBP1b-binding outer membrane lipoprotein LpoB
MKFRISVLTVAFLPAACQTPADPPSLLPRAIEKQSTATSAPSLPPTAQKPADSALTAQLSRLLADARAGDADFAALERSNAGTLAAGQRAVQGSEAWLSSEMARSALEVARQKSANALADVDLLLIARTEQASRDAETAGVSEILSAQAEINAIVERQTKRLSTLSR